MHNLVGLSEEFNQGIPIIQIGKKCIPYFYQMFSQIQNSKIR